MNTLEDIIHNGFESVIYLPNTKTHQEKQAKLENQATQQIQALIKECVPEKKDLSDYTLNMAVNTNPPNNTTRTNLYRNGVNDCIDEFKSNLKSRGLL